MSIKLYQIENSIQELLSKDELTLDELNQATQLDDSLQSKLDDMLAFQQENEQTLKAFENSLKSKLDTVKAGLNKSKALKDFILSKMQEYNLNELKSKHFLSVKVSASGCKPVIIDDIDIETIPQEFIKVTKEISKTAIKEALQGGEILQFARLGEQTKIIKIKG